MAKTVSDRKGRGIPKQCRFQRSSGVAQFPGPGAACLNAAVSKRIVLSDVRAVCAINPKTDIAYVLYTGGCKMQA